MIGDRTCNCIQDGQGSGWEVHYCRSSICQTYVLRDLCSNVSGIVLLYTVVEHATLVASECGSLQSMVLCVIDVCCESA